LALGLSRAPLLATGRSAAGASDGRLRQAALAVGMAFEQADRLARRWPVASISLLTLAALFGGLLLVSVPK